MTIMLMMETQNPEAEQTPEFWRMLPHTYAQVVSDGAWVAYRWLDWLSSEIYDRLAMGGARIIINAPPRHGKSNFISHWLPLWFLDNWPGKRVAIASYGSELATDFGRAIRNEARNNDRCSVELRDDSTSANRWHTVEGGGLVAVGVGGPLSGRGFDCGIIDDPIKNWEEAYSLRSRQKVIDWFNSVFYTRAEPGASIIVAMTRWHEDDLTGFLVEKHSDNWTVITMPAIAEAGDAMGRVEGEPLCPERYDALAIRSMMAGVGEIASAALYQQRPESFGSGRVYHKFDQRNIDSSLTLRDDLILHLSIDFNLNPGMHMIVGQYDSRADLFIATHEIHGPRMRIDGAMQMFEKIIADAGGFKWPELHVFGDATSKTMRDVTATSTGYEVVASMLRKMGIQYRIRVPGSNPNVRESVDGFNETLCDIEGRRHYAVHPRCERLIRDFKELKADETGSIDKSDHALSHAADAERYRVTYLRPSHGFNLPTEARVGTAA